MNYEKTLSFDSVYRCWRAESCNGRMQTIDTGHWVGAWHVCPHFLRSARPPVVVIEPFTGAPASSFLLHFFF